MFSFWGDTVLDPFCGTGTTMLAAMRTSRNSIGIEIDPEYCSMALKRLQEEGHTLFNKIEIKFEKIEGFIGKGPTGFRKLASTSG